MLTAISELLDTCVSQLRLTQSDLWPKYGADASRGGVSYNQDQRIHVDYPNHTLVHPTPWYRPEAVAAILYLSEFETSGGPTALVPREGERDLCYSPGTLLLYRHDVWHRGTPGKIGAMRLAQNLSFRRAESEWISTLHIGWAWQLYRRDNVLARLLATASLEQRAVLGFPQPGSSCWCPETIEAVRALYGAFGMDMAPYADAL